MSAVRAVGAAEGNPYRQASDLRTVDVQGQAYAYQPITGLDYERLMQEFPDLEMAGVRWLAVLVLLGARTSGGALAFPAGETPESVLQALPLGVILGVGTAIMAASGLDPGEEDPPPGKD